VAAVEGGFPVADSCPVPELKAAGCPVVVGLTAAADSQQAVSASTERLAATADEQNSVGERGDERRAFAAARHIGWEEDDSEEHWLSSEAEEVSIGHSRYDRSSWMMMMMMKKTMSYVHSFVPRQAFVRLTNQ